MTVATPGSSNLNSEVGTQRAGSVRLEIRQFRAGSEDRARVRKICCETGIAGLPIEGAWRGRELVADLWTLYYTDYEPESCFVAEHEGQVVGYITGCLSAARFDQTNRDHITPLLRRRLLSTGFVLHPMNLMRGLRLRRCQRGGEMRPPDLSPYPSHLHINLLEGYRGLGTGAELIARFVERCQANGSPGIHLDSISRHAISFFKRNGFAELSRRRFTLYDDILEPPTDLVFMGMKL